MCLYEVNLQIEDSIFSEYHQWLTHHVQEMVALDGFIQAEIFKVIEPSAKSGTVNFTVQYFLKDEAALKHYLKTHAARMRAEGKQRFGERFQATRRVLLSEQKIHAPA
ncbi:MAG: DUF4286 family protein [Bdellovibrionales bacterium]